jgi:hypothetical protein
MDRVHVVWCEIHDVAAPGAESARDPENRTNRDTSLTHVP